MHREGAYVLYLDVPRPLTLDVGILKDSFFPAGRYAYVGSASRGIGQRMARHRRLAHLKTGKVHWHIDYLLIHPETRLTREKALAGFNECEVSKYIAARKGVTIPVSRFGSADCRTGCKAHFYRLKSARRIHNG